MKKILTIFLFLSSIVLTFGQTKVIAHRGFWDTENSAQNSLTSLIKAAKAGCYGSEFDVQMTSDSVLVLFHDSELNGKRIVDTPFDSLKNYRLTNGETLPTLEQFFIIANNCPDIQLILEIKTNSDITSKSIQDLVSAVLKTVEKYKLNKRTEYIAFNFDVCKEIVSKNPTAKVYYLGGNLTPEVLKNAGLAGLDYHYNAFKEHPNYITESHKLGLKVNVWTVDDLKIMNRMIEQKVDFITTNKPLEFKEILK